MRDPLAGLRHLRGGIREKAGKQFHASERIADLVSQDGGDFRQSAGTTRALALRRQPFLLSDIANDPDRVTLAVDKFANVRAQNADRTISRSFGSEPFLLRKETICRNPL